MKLIDGNKIRFTMPEAFVHIAWEKFTLVMIINGVMLKKKIFRKLIYV